jgi:hypothetical protein
VLVNATDLYKILYVCVPRLCGKHSDDTLNKIHLLVDDPNFSTHCHHAIRNSKSLHAFTYKAQSLHFSIQLVRHEFE